MKNNKLMVVAHPDDESLYGGAQLVTDMGWKIICVTNGDNPIRRSEFETVMKKIDADFEIWNYPDERYELFNNNLKSNLEKIVSEQKWDKIVTHNRMGEYGHVHHMQIHTIMKSMVPNLWMFNFDSSHYLSQDIWEKKLELVSIYKSQKMRCEEHLIYVRNEKLTQNCISLL